MRQREDVSPGIHASRTYIHVGKKNPPFGGLKTPFSVGGVLKAQYF
jgi:hypothetical protein